MAAEKAVATHSDGGFWSELFHTNIFKATQGLMTRRLTCLAIWVAALVCAYKLLAGNLLAIQFQAMMGTASLEQPALTAAYVTVGLFVAAALWLGFRLVNWPPFADFLIAVEAEMNKVTWPTWDELKAAAWVVIFTMLSLAILIYCIDVLWTGLLEGIGWLMSWAFGKT